MKIAKNLDGVILQLDHSLSQLRRIARNMMPESLLKVGLEETLRDLCESLMNSETAVEFQANSIRKDTPAIVQTTIYRIAQELLSNALRHARASKIMLQCSQRENTIFMTVEDNGKGFDTAIIEETPGIGFRDIKNSVAYLKGKLDIVSAPDEGTAIKITLNAAG